MAEDGPAAVPVALLVGLGGFAGSALRHAVSLAVPGLGGTFLVNVVGSFALGALVAESRHVGRLGSATHLVAGAGVLSSFTTYSAFVVGSAGASAPLLAANVVGTYALGFLGALVGSRLVGRLAAGDAPRTGRSPR